MFRVLGQRLQMPQAADLINSNYTCLVWTTALQQLRSMGKPHLCSSHQLTSLGKGDPKRRDIGLKTITKAKSFCANTFAMLGAPRFCSK